MSNIILHNGYAMPQLGLGVYKAEDGKSAIDSVLWALEAGYRHIDTAMIYKNEKSVGDAIKSSSVDRKDIFLTTKLWNDDIRAKKAKEAFYKSLELLSTDYVDLYLLHWPAKSFEDSWTVLEELYKEGLIKAIGVSNFNKCHFDSLEKTATIVPMVNQIETHPYFQNQELIDYCLSKKIEITAWSPIGGSWKDANVLEDKNIEAIAKKHNKTIAQIIIRWHIDRNLVVIPKSVRKERIIQNFNIFDFKLDSEDMKVMKSLDKNRRFGPDPENFDF